MNKWFLQHRLRRLKALSIIMDTAAREAHVSTITSGAAKKRIFRIIFMSCKKIKL